MAEQGHTDEADDVHVRLVRGREALAARPYLWMGFEPCSQRDLDLFSCGPVDFIGYDHTSYLRKITTASMEMRVKSGKRLFVTNEEQLRRNEERPGGFFLAARHRQRELHVKVDIPKDKRDTFNATTGFLRSFWNKFKFLQGPPESHSAHTWDAMIIYDCTVTPEGTLQGCLQIATRKWDILLMKVADDYEYPWLVAAINDSGAYTDLRHDPFDIRQRTALEFFNGVKTF
ncbi:putative aaa family atpase protein [Daldinia childiae]|uniref:putative aaa family atpase protein n=1 Tax=Daldinia childiae TaxID=326645 RepID=UPI001444CD80|nr:putative aaa family atpase protein [Daldinia childiae]KAF3058517.1 putative aaa family atpase protein [Daldinia childiae]